MSAITEWKGYYQDWRGGVRENDFYVSDDALTFMRQCRREAALERIIARQARTITAREKSILEIWQDWRIERDNVVLAREQRDEARQLAADFKAALESAQRNYAASVEMLKAIGAALNVRTLGEIIPAIEAQAQRVTGCVIFLNDGGDVWQHVKNNDTSDPVQCLYCGEAWPCVAEVVKESLDGAHDTEIREALK